MADLNQVSLIGRLTRDPELRSTPGGVSFCAFGLATGRKFKGQDGTQKEDVLFVDVTTWGKTAEVVSKYTKKGRLIFVGGRLRLEQWDDKQTGQKRSKISVVGENVQFLDYGDKQQQTPQLTPIPAMQAIQQAAKPIAQAWEEPDLGEPPF